MEKITFETIEQIKSFFEKWEFKELKRILPKRINRPINIADCVLNSKSKHRAPLLYKIINGKDGEVYRRDEIDYRLQIHAKTGLFYKEEVKAEHVDLVFGGKSKHQQIEITRALYHLRIAEAYHNRNELNYHDRCLISSLYWGVKRDKSVCVNTFHGYNLTLDNERLRAENDRLREQLNEVKKEPHDELAHFKLDQILALVQKPPKPKRTHKQTPPSLGLNAVEIKEIKNLMRAHLMSDPLKEKDGIFTNESVNDWEALLTDNPQQPFAQMEISTTATFGDVGLIINELWSLKNSSSNGKNIFFTDRFKKGDSLLGYKAIADATVDRKTANPKNKTMILTLFKHINKRLNK